jgi:hypothetical protein
VNKNDEIKEKEIQDSRVKRKKKGFFIRLLAHNRPILYIWIGLIASIIVGSVFPSFAVFWTKVLFVMMKSEKYEMGKELLKY